MIIFKSVQLHVGFNKYVLKIIVSEWAASEPVALDLIFFKIHVCIGRTGSFMFDCLHCFEYSYLSVWKKVYFEITF